MPTTYDVRIWKTRVYKGATGNTYRVRWFVAGREHAESFRHSGQADSVRSRLLTAAKEGESFDVTSGYPVSWQRTTGGVSWYEFACRYVDMKWKSASGKYRKSIAEALVTITATMFATERGRPDDGVIRRALAGWAFNTKRRDDAERPESIAAAL